MKFFVTFGQKYRTEPHPVLGLIPSLPDQWVEIEAETVKAAHDAAMILLMQAWSMMYSEAEFDDSYYPKGKLIITQQTTKMDSFALWHRALPSSSSLERLAQCPGSYQLALSQPFQKTTSEAAERGHKIHAALAIHDPSGLSQDELESYEQCDEAARGVIDVWADGREYHEQHESFYFNSVLGAPLGGTMDVDIWREDHALVIDYKTGRKAVSKAALNLQGRAYAVLAAINHRAKHIRVAVVQPLVGVTVTDYMESDLRESVRELSQIILRAFEGDAPRIVGSECGYCEAKKICPEFLDIPNTHPIQIALPTDPDFLDRLKKYGPLLPTLKASVEFYEKEIRGALERIEVQPTEVSYILMSSNGRRQINDPAKTYEAFKDILSPAEFAAAVSISRAGIKRAVGAKIVVQKASELEELIDKRLDGIYELKEQRASLIPIK